MKKDDKVSDYKNLSVDVETYKKIGELSKKDNLTKIRCIYYMTRYFHENDISVIPGNQVTKDGAAALIKQDSAHHAERVIRLLKAFEKEYLRPIAMKTATTDIHLHEVVTFLHHKQIMEEDLQTDACENNQILTEGNFSNDDSSVGFSSELERLRERNRELEIESGRKGLLLSAAADMLENVISPAFCALLERGDLAARTRKFRSRDIEEIEAFIKQCR